MNLITTIKGSLLENFFPAGWDLKKFDKICSLSPSQAGKPERWWNRQFQPVPCNTLGDFDTFMGHEIAWEIKKARDAGRKIVFILPVGPMGMYRWAVFFLKAWNVACDHVYGFNMDEWSDGRGETLPANDPGAFQNAMEQAFYGPLGELTVPKGQRNFATRKNLPPYPEKIAELKKHGARLVTVFGVGRVCHIAFWEPHFAAEFESVEQWKLQTHRLGAKLHPLTIEQNALTSFKSRTTLVPAYANTIGPGLFLQSDFCIGGADGAYPDRGAMWQGMSLCVTLQYGPTPWIPSSWMPTMPGRLFFMKQLGGPLLPDAH